MGWIWVQGFYAMPTPRRGIGPAYAFKACASATTHVTSFDLVVSNILLHEMPHEMLEAVNASFRLLKPGGLAVHQDVPTQRPDTPAFQQWLSNWQVAHNDEPFWQSFAETSVPGALISAGFSKEDVFESYQPQIDGLGVVHGRCA